LISYLTCNGVSLFLLLVGRPICCASAIAPYSRYILIMVDVLMMMI